MNNTEATYDFISLSSKSPYLTIVSIFYYGVRSGISSHIYWTLSHLIIIVEEIKRKEREKDKGWNSLNHLKTGKRTHC